MEEKLRTLSSQMKEEMKRCARFHEEMKAGKRFSFYEEIVPFVNDVQAEAEKWRGEAMTFVQTYTPSDLHPNQVEHTYENMYVLATESFQSHVREQRYQERLQSVEYVLNLLEQAIGRN